MIKMSCSNCGTLLPAEARFCLTCGAPQTSSAEPRAQDEPRGAGDVPLGSIASYDPAVCEIGFWRGYVKGEFFALAREGDEVWELARSPAFRCRGRDAPREDDPRAVAAYDRLLEVLAEEGWEPVSGGRPWYAYRFRRRADHAPPLAAVLRPPARRPSRATADDPVG